jgi:hypothetical protein
LNRKEATSSAIICILLASSIIFIGTANFGEGERQKAFYVGVTYGGDSVQDAKTLIDKVSNYTNLFVLQSGSLKNDASTVNEIGDYAVSKGLHFAAYFDVLTPAKMTTWVGTAEQRWGSMFAGVYLGDEPGGKMLDDSLSYTLTPAIVQYSGGETNRTVHVIDSGISGQKDQVGIVSYSDGDCLILFYPTGKITVQKGNQTSSYEPDPTNASIINWNQISSSNLTTYERNGSITIYESITKSTSKIYSGNSFNPLDSFSTEILMKNFYTIENGSDRIAQVETCQEIVNKNPMANCSGAASIFVNETNKPVKNLKSEWNISEGSFPVFTADYGLYWWDYKSDYDMVLAELGWNNSVAQEIGLVRGAANLQGKSWGTILTWKYTQAPYLAGGNELFEQMKTSYEAGAEYVIVFNYAKDMSGPYGTLQGEHFEALEQFWNEVVQNPTVVHGSVKPEAVLVLPENYGWGMRNPSDIIWGIWEPNATSNQIWTQVQNKLDQYGTKLDIVYYDPELLVAGKYANIYFWDKT